MHGFAVVPERLLGKPFGVADGLRPLGAGVAVAVQCHAFDAELAAARAEFRGAVPCPLTPSSRIAMQALSRNHVVGIQRKAAKPQKIRHEFHELTRIANLAAD